MGWCVGYYSPARLGPQKPGVRRQNSGVFERGGGKGLLGETAARDQKSLRGAKKSTGCGTEFKSVSGEAACHAV